MDYGLAPAAPSGWPPPGEGWVRAGQWELDCQPSAPSAVRRLVGAALGGDQWADLRPDAVLIASELTANAWLHGQPPVEARLLVSGEAVRIEIADGSVTPPVCPPAGGLGLTGRGIGLVAALAARWGVAQAGSGKIIWAELAGETELPGDAEPPAATRAPDLAPPDAGDPTRVTVRLGDVPTDLLLAAKNHVDGLMREFTLAMSGARNGSSGPLPGRLADLLRIVTTRFAEPREAIRRLALTAAAGGAPRTTLDLKLSATSAEAGDAYLTALEEIESYARAARLLTLQSPPQHVAFRRWYVRSLVDQLRALETGGAPVATPTFEQYLLDTLDAEVLAGRATERAARLQRVTAALATATTPEQVAAVVVSESVTALGAAGGGLLVPAEPGSASAAQVQIPGAVGYGDELMAQLRAERLDDQLPAAEALRSGRPVWLESRAECYQRYPDLARLEPSVVAMCCLPLVVTDQVLGALRFSFDHPHLFDPDERAFAEAIAAQTALAMERARLFAAERRARERAAFLTTAAELFASTLDSGQILDRLLGLLVPRYADAAAVWRIPMDGAGVASLLEATAVTAATAGGTDALRTLTGRPPLPVVTAARRGVPVHDLATGTSVFPLLVAGRAAAVVALGRQRHLRRQDGTQDDPAGPAGPGRPVYGTDPADETLTEELVRRASNAFGNALQYERERAIAVTLQRSMLPRRPPDVAGLTVAWRYLPGSAGALVGGDWYDVLHLDGGRAALVIGDVMGHGLHAAATMGQIRAAARAYAGERFAPAVVLGQLDAAMSRLEQGSITTVAMGVLDPADGSLTVASAGHLPPLIVPPRGEPWYPPVEPGPPLSTGVAQYPESQLVLEPGSTLLLYTDGLVEDRIRPIDEGLELLRRSATPDLPPEELCDLLLAALGRTGDNDDDVAMLAVRLGS
ncbi:SpoIIE family protein phosphatase [Parafrankia elaeagni]|uniref:SpoIIE family protein phosphatase n=1 Tax=Parafrankia elaeagni TaxID=222534 RepID=UPI00036E80B2|nr:SpoIIE family protein phosphatase [Parafrankia elaeagni]